MTCVFVKYRNIVKFEDFYRNHPAIYLAFVIQNFLSIGILPNIYRNENILLENSRIELFQNNNILLNTLVTIINCVLNININLDETTFKRNIETLKNSKRFSRDELINFLSIETYMSRENKDVFLHKLSLYFPQNSIQKTLDAIPSFHYYQTTTLHSINIWGPAFWSVIHYTAYVLDLELLVDQKPFYKESLCCLAGFFDILLPCITCRYHYANVIPLNQEEEHFPRPFPLTLSYISFEFARKNQLFDFYSLLHNSCKPMEKREFLGVQFYKDLYKRFYQSRLINKSIS